MPFGIRVFSFGLHDPSCRETDDPADAEPNREADAQRTIATEQQGTSNSAKPSEDRDIFRRGFFPVF